MEFIEQSIPGVYVIEPKKFGDARGYFMETYRQDLFEQHVGKIDFVQDNESRSTYGVLRGLHFQKGEFSQAKLVRVIEGCVLDVAVDLRKSSPTFGKYVAVELSSENARQLFIPRGFAHGFLVLSPTATFVYKVDNVYAPNPRHRSSSMTRRWVSSGPLPKSRCCFRPKTGPASRSPRFTVSIDNLLSEIARGGNQSLVAPSSFWLKAVYA